MKSRCYHDIAEILLTVILNLNSKTKLTCFVILNIRFEYIKKKLKNNYVIHFCMIFGPFQIQEISPFTYLFAFNLFHLRRIVSET